MNRSTFRTAIDAALPTVAAVLCAIIADYGYELPHTWKPDGLLYTTVVDPTGTDLQHNDADSSAWTKVVSSAGFVDGRRSWTIEMNRYESVGVGITSDQTNGGRTTRRIASRQTTTIAVFTGTIRTYIDGQNDRCFTFPSNQTFIAIDFLADPSSRSVVARFGDIGQLTLRTATSDDEFWSWRPCAILAGNVNNLRLLSYEK